MRLDDIVDAMHDKDVVLLGETHDDVVAHHLQLQLLRKIHSQMSRCAPLPSTRCARSRRACIPMDGLQARQVRRPKCNTVYRNPGMYVQGGPLDSTFLGNV